MFNDVIFVVIFVSERKFLFNSGNFEAMLNYSHVLDRWHELRKNKSDSEVNANVNTLQHENKTTEIIIREFFEKMDWTQFYLSINAMKMINLYL